MSLTHAPDTALTTAADPVDFRPWDADATQRNEPTAVEEVHEEEDEERALTAPLLLAAGGAAAGTSAL